MAKKFIIFACMSLLAGVPCSAAIITVDPNGSADYTTIQAAINDANDFDTVIVADGTYTGLGNRNIDFLGKPITIKSANGPQNCIIDCQGSYGNYHRGFYFHNDEGPDSILDGLTITNGLEGYDPAQGGGIKIDSSSPTIQNCVISDNTISSTYSALGGGIFLRDSLSLIENCIISNNSVDANPDESGDSEGGGIFLWSSDVTIRNCIIAGNSSKEGSGGGIYGGNNTPVITNCTIIDNKCETWSGFGNAFGGGLFDCDGPITNCIIRNNVAEDGGDQLYESSTPTYSCIQDWTGSGIGNIDTNPFFADLGNGDYHLKSQSGRWDPNSESWVLDDVTSPCIDAGDPNSDWTQELWPHGKRINMGTYGNTPEASRGCGSIYDLQVIAADWLQSDSVTDIIPFPDGDGIVDLRDYAFLFEHWLCQEY